MTKQSLKTTKKTATKPTTKRSSFERWLLPGLLTVTFYLVSMLVAAVYLKSEAGLTPEASTLTSILFTIAIASAFWWLLESARWTMETIERRSKPASKKKK